MMHKIPKSSFKICVCITTLNSTIKCLVFFMNLKQPKRGNRLSSTFFLFLSFSRLNPIDFSAFIIQKHTHTQRCSLAQKLVKFSLFSTNFEKLPTKSYSFSEWRAENKKTCLSFCGQKSLFFHAYLIHI